MSTALFKRPQGHPPIDFNVQRSILSLLEVGWPCSEISQVTRVSDVTCRSYAKRWGMRTVKAGATRRVTEEQKIKMRVLIEAGHTANQVADACGVSRPTVGRYAVMWGLRVQKGVATVEVHYQSDVQIPVEVVRPRLHLHRFNEELRCAYCDVSYFEYKKTRVECDAGEVKS